MNAKSLIQRQRDGTSLTREDFDFLVRGAIRGEIPPYQLTAWMMAVFFRGLTPQATADLTLAMLESGDRLPVLSRALRPADKHSTGGVGDKISLLVAPLVAACGVPVPMISGRSLGHTGGTLDKLESIPGFRTVLSVEELVRQVETIGLCIAGQSDRLVPADRIFYGLRDAASIVESVPLITASILSKKAAAGIRGLALDVKCGSGAFMTDPESARRLAESLVETGALMGIRARAHLTRMDRVIGYSAGNALEIAESIRALRGEGVSASVRELTLELGGSMLELVGASDDCDEGKRAIARAWESGAGYERFARMVESQGGDIGCVRDPERLPKATSILEVGASKVGWFLGIQARPVGEWITEVGGGRLQTGDVIDPRVGVEILAAPGDRVQAGETVLRLHLPLGGAAPSLAGRASQWVLLADVEEPPRSELLDTVEPRGPGADLPSQPGVSE